MKKLLLIKFTFFYLLSPCTTRLSTISRHRCKENGVELVNPWAGGANVPQFSPIDLNADNILDLMIFDKNGDQINCFYQSWNRG